MDTKLNKELLDLVRVDWLGHNLAHTSLEALLLNSCIILRMSSKSHDVGWSTVHLRTALQNRLRGLEAVHDRHIAVHEDQLEGWVELTVWLVLTLLTDMILDGVEGGLATALSLGFKTKFEVNQSL